MNFPALAYTPYGPVGFASEEAFRAAPAQCAHPRGRVLALSGLCCDCLTTPYEATADQWAEFVKASRS